jgi:hypothetical protein
VRAIPTEGIVGAAALREAATGEYRQIIDLVQAALVKKLGYEPDKAWMVCIEAIFADRVIVRRDGRYWSYGYTLGPDNQVTLSDPEEVLETYVPVAVREAAAESWLVEAKAADGTAWDAILVRAGRSKNGNYYPDSALREAVPLFDGARVFVKSDEEHLKDKGKDPRNIAGWISEPRFVEGQAPDTGYVAGRLNIAAGMRSLRETLVDAWRRGKRDLVGLSIDAYALTKSSVREGVKRIAEKFVRVSSVDIIVEPSAGGALVNLLEAADPKERDPMKERMLATIKAKRPELYAKINPDTITDEELEARYAEALAIAPQPQPQPESKDDDKPVTVAQLRMIEARAYARAQIASCGLPEPARERLQARFDGMERFTEADVDAEIKAERAYLARFVESGRVRMEGLDIHVEDRSVKIADMLDAFFDRSHKDHARVQSFRECYIEMTGDRRVTGKWENVDKARLAESVGAAFRESLDSSSWANVLGNAITRRMVKEYRENTAWDAWRLACDRVPVTDFRTNERTRIGGYGNLPTVAQGAPYTALTSPSDEKATYAASKRGGTEDLTLEMIRNDDVGAIRRIPIALARAAKRTLCEFVLDFVRTNPTIYDGVAFFHATHGNLGSSALDATTLAAARLRMKKQTEAGSNKRLGIGPRYLWVPDDLEQTAVDLFNRNTNLDKTFVQQMSLTVVPVPYWTDTNDWAISADVDDLVGIEIGFLDGNEEPEMFVQDSPTVGSMFSNDKVTYKIRHIYGGNVINYRAWDKSVVP